jgi:hypothetical protein
MRATTYAAAPLVAVVLLVCAGAAGPSEFRSGVWIANDAAALPLPTSGYQLYLIGEMHGVQENVSTFEAYLRLLAHSGIRDVAIEEDSVYERAAEAYVTGKAAALPVQLCLRSGVLEVVRRFNASRSSDQVIRVHLVDIDSPATAIREHLAILKSEFPGAASFTLPNVDEITRRGQDMVERFRRVLPPDHKLQGELRTIERSIQAYRDGFEAGDGAVKGSPYLEAREEAVTANVRDVLKAPDSKGLLMQYGWDHVSKAERKDGGPNRDSLFAPTALRLERSGVKLFSLLTVPLSGTWQWRGRKGEMLWSVSDTHLSTGEPLGGLLAAAGYPRLLYIEPKLEPIRLPGQDLQGFRVDGYLLFARATALSEGCTGRRQ